MRGYMNNKIMRLRGDNQHACGALRSATLRQRLAAASWRLAQRRLLHFSRFLQIVSPSVAPVRIDSRASSTLTGRRN